MLKSEWEKCKCIQPNTQLNAKKRPFANVLLDLGLPSDKLAIASGDFNFGVELGQIAVMLVFLPLAWMFRHTTFYRWLIVVSGSLAFAVLGEIWIM